MRNNTMGCTTTVRNKTKVNNRRLPSMITQNINKNQFYEINHSDKFNTLHNKTISLQDYKHNSQEQNTFRQKKIKATIEKLFVQNNNYNQSLASCIPQTQLKDMIKNNYTSRNPKNYRSKSEMVQLQKVLPQQKTIEEKHENMRKKFHFQSIQSLSQNQVDESLNTTEQFILNHKKDNLNQSSSRSTSDLSDIHSTILNTMPYHYQFNHNDSDFLKEKKYQLRLKDLYSMISKNQACILPDPALQCLDGIPLFQIFTEDFQEHKKFNSFKFNFLLRDTKKNTCQLMGDILRPQIIKLKAKNQNFKQSNSLLQLKSKLVWLKKKKKQEEMERLKEQVKEQERVYQQSKRNSFQAERKASQGSVGSMGGGSSMIKSRPVNKLSSNVLEKQGSTQQIKHQAQQHMDYNSHITDYIPYDTHKLFDTTMFQENGLPSQGKLLEVKEKWEATKLKLENKIKNYNVNQEKIKKILALVQNNKKDNTGYKYEKIKNKYESQKRSQNDMEPKLSTQLDKEKLSGSLSRLARQSLIQDQINAQIGNSLKNIFYRQETKNMGRKSKIL